MLIKFIAFLHIFVSNTVQVVKRPFDALEIITLYLHLSLFGIYKKSNVDPILAILDSVT
jgi:hypothetical protein